MASKLERLLDELGMNDRDALNKQIKDAGIDFSMLRCVFRIMTTVDPHFSRDPMGHYAFRWKDDTTASGLVKLTFLIQADELIRLPHEHVDGTRDVDINVDAFQLFALAFDCVSNAVERIIPTVNEEAQTSGPSVFYTRNMYLKLYIPGVQ